MKKSNKSLDFNTVKNKDAEDIVNDVIHQQVVNFLKAAKETNKASNQEAVNQIAATNEVTLNQIDDTTNKERFDIVAFE
jgi:hypothetical protein